MISIVDIHLFKDEKEALIPKEVAFVAEENDFIAYWDTSPSASLKWLPLSVEEHNNYLT